MISRISAICYVVLAMSVALGQPTTAPVNTPVQKVAASGNLTAGFNSAQTHNFLSGAAVTFNAGSTLTINGALAGTPTGGTLNLSSTTLTLPASVSGGTSSFQPLDSDLTAIAGLPTTASGRSLLTASALTAAGLGLTNGAAIDAWGAVTNSSGLAGRLSDETGTGSAVFSNSPTLVTPTINAINAAAGTNLDLSGGTSGATLSLRPGATGNGVLTGVQQDTSNRFSLLLYDRTAVAANIGGGIGFGGNYTGTTTTVWAGISGLKSTATDGEFGGHISFRARANGSSISEVGTWSTAALTSNVNIGVGGAPLLAYSTGGSFYGTGSNPQLRLVGSNASAWAFSTYTNGTGTWSAGLNAGGQDYRITATADLSGTANLAVSTTGTTIGGTSTIKGMRTATSALAFGTVTAGTTSSTLTITVTGAAQGDSAIVDRTDGGGWGGAIIVDKWVTANTVNIRLRNTSGGDIVVGTPTVRATVLSF